MPSLGSSSRLWVIWDTREASKVDVVVGCFSLSMLLDTKVEGVGRSLLCMVL